MLQHPLFSIEMFMSNKLKTWTEDDFNLYSNIDWQFVCV